MSSPASLTLPSPPSNAHLEEMWAYLLDATQHIFRYPENLLSPKAQSDLYTTVYNYCTLPRAVSRASANLGGEELYYVLRDYFINHLELVAQDTVDLGPADLLEVYVTRWKRYMAASNILNRGFSFINRSWVKRERDEGKRYIYPIDTLALSLWKDKFLPALQRHGDGRSLTDLLIDLLTEYRNGNEVNLDLVKDTLDTLIFLGRLDAPDSHVESLNLYKDDFEFDFLIATEVYYTNESEKLLSELTDIKDDSAYFNEVNRRLSREEYLGEKCLLPSTRSGLVSGCEEIFRRKYIDVLTDHASSLLINEDMAALQHTYSILSRLSDGLKPLRRCFTSTVQEYGFELLRQLPQTPSAPFSIPPLSSTGIDTVTYGDALLHIQTKYSNVVARCFNNDRDLLFEFKKVFKEAVNRNPATGFNASKSAEVVGRYVGGLIDSPGVQAYTQTFNSALQLGEFLEENGVFRRAAGVD